MRSKKSFAEVTAEVERLFQPYDLDKLSNLAAAGNPPEVHREHQTSRRLSRIRNVLQLDMGALMRPGEHASSSPSST